MAPNLSLVMAAQKAEGGLKWNLKKQNTMIFEGDIE